MPHGIALDLFTLLDQSEVGEYLLRLRVVAVGALARFRRAEIRVPQ
jgi:hypothetical protein